MDVVSVGLLVVYVFFFQAEDGIRDLVRSRGLGDVYKRQRPSGVHRPGLAVRLRRWRARRELRRRRPGGPMQRLSLIHI